MVQEDLGKIEFTQVGKFGARGLRGQFHKAKKFVITKIIFVNANISNFVFSISTVC